MLLKKKFENVTIDQMSTKQVVALAFFASFVGSIFGFLGTQKIQQTKFFSSSAKNGQAQNIARLSNQEFLSEYQVHKNDLAPGERALADRLYASLSENKNEVDKPAPQKAKVDTSRGFTVMGPLAPQKPRKILADVGKPKRIEEEAYLSLFPGSYFSGKENDYGVKKGLSGKIQDFLKDNVCPDPKLSMVSDEIRSQSKFFESVKENTYQGQTEIFPSGKIPDRKLITKFEFGGAAEEGDDSVATRENQTFIEQRIIPAEPTSAAWRYNSCGLSVVLLSDHCPWNDKYTSEYKDIYLAPDSKKLIGNIYCKTTTDMKWTNVGNFVLDQSSE